MATSTDQLPPASPPPLAGMSDSESRHRRGEFALSTDNHLSGTETWKTRRRHPTYTAIYKKHDQTKRRQALRLAQETRNALRLERELALQRVRETEALLDILHTEVRISEVKVEEADIQVGVARALFKLASNCETDTGTTDGLHCPTNLKQGPLRSTAESEASDEDYETDQDDIYLPDNPPSCTLSKEAISQWQLDTALQSQQA